MAMLDTPYLGGAFNFSPIFDIQLYLWCFALLVVMLGISELVWVFSFWKPITPFHGLWNAYKNRSNAVFVFDVKQYWDLVSESGAKLIFNRERYDFATGIVNSLWRWINPAHPEHIHFSEFFRNFRIWLFNTDYSIHTAKMLQGDWDEYPLVTIGQTPAEILFDAYHWTDMASKDREQIARCVDVYNDSNTSDEIHSLGKFYRYATSKPEPKITCPNVKLTVTIPWVRIDSAFPIHRYKAAWAGYLRQLADDLSNKSQTDINRFAILVVVLGVIVVILMFIGKWLHLV